MITKYKFIIVIKNLLFCYCLLFRGNISENRYILIGYTKKNNLLFVSFTDKNNVFRIISARKATKSERMRHEGNKGKFCYIIR